jgi:2-methylcitrate dehydratase PrpD
MGTEKIAEFIARTNYEEIPEKAIAVAKMCMLDGLGVALAGTRESAGRIITRYVKNSGGKPEAGVIGGGFKTSIELAALANGTLVHVLDYDDHAITWMGHPTSVLLPAVIALGERDGLSGQQILEAYVIGWEVGSKLCSKLSMGLTEQGWHPTATLGTFAAAAACGKLVKLNSKQMSTALGIAASEAAGLRQNFGTDTKAFQVGRAGANAIAAILLTQMGFTASQNILEGPFGFCRVFAKKECDPDAMAQDLGSPFDISTSYAVKPYPCCGLFQRCIDAMLYLVKNYQFSPDQVAEVECHIPTMLHEIMFHSPPETGLQGKFSLKYCIASALVDREVTLRHFTDEKVQSPVLRGFMAKVKLSYNEGIIGESLLRMPQKVEVKLRDGTEYAYAVEWPVGYSYNPLSWDEVTRKFGDCADGVLLPNEADRVITLVSKLESLKSVSELMTTVSKRKL